MGSEVGGAQLIIGCIAMLIVGTTFVPIWATPSALAACRASTDQKLVKFGGIAITVLTSISAILFLEVLKLNNL